MTTIKTNTVIFLCLAFSFAILFFVSQAEPRVAYGNAATATAIGAASTTASVAVTTSTRVLATTTSLTGTSYTRVYATICNPNANPVAILLNNDKAANVTTGQATAIIAAAAGYNVCYEITERNQYNGSVTASSTSQASTRVFVSQYVQ